MGFQNGAFQTPIAFQSQTGIPSGGYIRKIDSEAYAYVYNHADMLRRRVQNLPEEVKEVVQELVNVESKADREFLLNQELRDIDFRFKLAYLELLEMYRDLWVEDELRRIFAERKRQEEEAAILLLLL